MYLLVLINILLLKYNIGVYFFIRNYCTNINLSVLISNVNKFIYYSTNLKSQNSIRGYLILVSGIRNPVDPVIHYPVTVRYPVILLSGTSLVTFQPKREECESNRKAHFKQYNGPQI